MHKGSAITIDDSRAIRSIIKRTLKDVGFQNIHEAENGQDAIDKLKKIGKVDIALVDWNMPVMNGLDFVKQIREDKSFDDMLIMMVTTETETSQMVKALSNGANEYMMKPFSKEILIEKLKLFGFDVNE